MDQIILFGDSLTQQASFDWVASLQDCKFCLARPDYNILLGTTESDGFCCPVYIRRLDVVNRGISDRILQPIVDTNIAKASVDITLGWRWKYYQSSTLLVRRPKSASL